MLCFDGMHYLGDLIKLYLCFIATPDLNLRACSAYFVSAVFAHKMSGRERAVSRATSLQRAPQKVSTLSNLRSLTLSHRSTRAFRFRDQVKELGYKLIEEM